MREIEQVIAADFERSLQLNFFAALRAGRSPSSSSPPFALWLFARPGPARKWKLACGSALASAALALLANQAVAVFWNRARPYATHPDSTLFGARSHDPSFPSDHASAAFIVVRLARPPVARIVGVLERLTDPFVALVWRFAPGGPKPATD